MIARVWTGAVRREDADAYAEDDRYLIERGPTVSHYEVAGQKEPS